MIAHDKGKPAARQGRKAVSLRALLNESEQSATGDCLVAEGDPKKAGHCELLFEKARRARLLRLLSFSGMTLSPQE
jgi:hypothetical protein